MGVSTIPIHFPIPNMSFRKQTSPSFTLQMKAEVAERDMLNPLNASSDTISEDIIGIHDSQAKRQDVDSLYNVVSNNVMNSTKVGEFLGVKHHKTVELIEDKVPESNFMPSFSALKEIACQLRCQPFNPNTAHKTIVKILKMLETYTWDAKAVIALSAFSLDYGESLRLSLTEATNADSLQLHVFRLGATEKDKPTKLTDQLNESVNKALRMIRNIIDLEKQISKKNIILSKVPGLSSVKPEVFTYWAIFTLAFASQITHLEWNVPDVLTKLSAIFLELDDVLKKLEKHEADMADYNWAVGVVRTPAGIRDLLRALIFTKKVAQLDQIILDTSTNTYVKEELLVKYKFLLFFSGLDNIHHEISNLKDILDEFKKDEKKQHYKILWIPAVEKWTDETTNNFEKIKVSMPWYVVHHFEPRSIRILQEEFHYSRKPIVVVTNPRGEIVHINAMHMITVWGIKAFPFQVEDEKRLSEQWKWLWFETKNVQPDVGRWVNEGKYIFLYGGVDSSVTQKLTTYLDIMKKDIIWKQVDASIEQLNLANVELHIASKFWDNINNLLLSHVSNDDYERDPVVKGIEMLLSMKKEKGWVLVSNGQNVLAIICDPLATTVLKEYKEWTKNITKEQGFDEAFMEYYNDKRPEVTSQPCLRLRVDNIRSKVRMNLPCPCCDLMMEIESITYNCCHGKVSKSEDLNVPVQKQPCPCCDLMMKIKSITSNCCHGKVSKSEDLNVPVQKQPCPCCDLMMKIKSITPNCCHGKVSKSEDLNVPVQKQL